MHLRSGTAGVPVAQLARGPCQRPAVARNLGFAVLPASRFQGLCSIMARLSVTRLGCSETGRSGSVSTKLIFANALTNACS